MLLRVLLHAIRILLRIILSDDGKVDNNDHNDNDNFPLI